MVLFLLLKLTQYVLMYWMQDTRRTRRGGQNKRNEIAERWKENMKNPSCACIRQVGVLRPELSVLRHGLQPVQERPLPPGLQPDERSTSVFTTGNSDQRETPDQHACSEQTEDNWILLPNRETSSVWRLWPNGGIIWEGWCLFMPYSARWCMWERTIISHRKFCTSNCMRSRPWLYKSHWI